ncbi:tyrosine-type recombinase/integrase [Agrobacterium larrymoorei]|uniref:tyrosine-type recombinase/integrase n=1 Tax=Agrobacterium larrymoorei TaxID=160699 RepID=UPI0030BE7D82
MAAIHKLVAKGLSTLPPGKHEDGAGLRFLKRPDGRSWWILRITVYGRRREMGLGAYPAVTLAEARRMAEDARSFVRAGKDPILERERQRRERERNLHLLADVAKDAFETRKAELKGDGKAGRWFTPLELHVLPKLGKTPVSQIDQIAIRDTLKPIWDAKGETARKAMNRLNIVMTHAAALGLDVDLQAVEKAKALLGKSRHEAKNIPSMAWQDVPDFYKTLGDESVTHLALRLLILTGVRSTPLRHIRDEQITRETIDGHEIDIWTVPAEMQKGRKGETSDFRVPLSAEALAVIKEARKVARDGYLLPAYREGVISDMTLGMHMRRAELTARPHGFRSSLRNWLAACTDAPHEIAELCLQHTVGNKVSRSYLNYDYIVQRKALMDRWAVHVRGIGGKVVQIAETAAA